MLFFMPLFLGSTKTGLQTVKMTTHHAWHATCTNAVGWWGLWQESPWRPKNRTGSWVPWACHDLSDWTNCTKLSMTQKEQTYQSLFPSLDFSTSMYRYPVSFSLEWSSVTSAQTQNDSLKANQHKKCCWMKSCQSWSWWQKVAKCWEII